MNLVSFQHANTLRAVEVNVDLLFAVQHSETHKCTHLISTAGAIIPVSDTVEQVNNRLKQQQQKPVTRRTK